MKFLVLVLSFLFIQFRINAQQDSSSSRSMIKIGGFYSSHLHYYGRTDSLNSTGFFPIAELWIGQSLYISATPVFVNNSVSNLNYAGTVLSAGWLSERINGWSGTINLTKPLYRESGQLVQSALKAQLAGTLTRHTMAFNVTAGADIKLSEDFDFGVSASLDHPFRFEFNKKILLIDPSAAMHAGSQRFAETFYKQNHLLFLPATTEAVTQNAKKFSILSYEFSSAIILLTGKFQVIITPSYIIPQSLIVIEGRRDMSERGKEKLYFIAGLKYEF